MDDFPYHHRNEECPIGPEIKSFMVQYLGNMSAPIRVN